MDAGWWQDSYTGRIVERIRHAVKVAASTSATRRWSRRIRADVTASPRQINQLTVIGCLGTILVAVWSRPELWHVKELIVRGVVALAVLGMIRIRKR